MVKVSELVIKIVKTQQAEVVKTLGPKGTEIEKAALISASVANTSPGRKQAPKSAHFSSGTWKPRNIANPL